MNAVDTNILIYAHDPRDRRKQCIAQTLIATCLNAGISTLYSEDYDAYSVIDGMELRNPFRNTAFDDQAT